MNDNNPLKQYFRRPGIYLKLPSGGLGYDKSVLDLPESGELPVYPMTAIDEITTRTPDALFNGEAVVSIIKSCIPAIKNPWKITNVDLDAILVAIRAATNGNEMDLETTCPSCNESSKYGINLVGLLSKFKPGDYEKEMPVGDLYIKFRPLTLKEVNAGNTVQFEMQRLMLRIQDMDNEEEQMKESSRAIERMNDLGMQVVCDSIEQIRTPETVVTEKGFILEFLQNCNQKTFESIRQTTVDLRLGTETQPFKVQCIHCEYEYDQPFTLNVADFFG
jgi:hypothetical protein